MVSKSLVRKAIGAVLAIVALASCRNGADLPQAPPPPFAEQATPDLGFPIKPRPLCSPEVLIAAGDPKAIGRLAASGLNFTCGPASDPLPLNNAVLTDDVVLVRALLEAHADPNARWFAHGDHIALQEAIELRAYNRSTIHRVEIVRLLLEHGADPNARWCPFESRGPAPNDMSCVSRHGVTALIEETARDEPDLVFLLLNAGADPEMEESSGATAMDYGHGEAVLYLLIAKMFPEAEGRAARALNYLNHRPRPSADRSHWPWDDTPLTRAIAGRLGGNPMLPPPPPPSPGKHQDARVRPEGSFVVGRVKVLLTLGANPNERVHSGSADWTPLAIAVGQGDTEVIEALLERGGEVNERWCAPVSLRSAPWEPSGNCTLESGTTPLMLAASLGNVEIVKLLLKRGADPQLRDWEKKNALDYAVRAKNRDSVRLLQSIDRHR